MVLVLVGGEVPDDGRLPGLQRVSVLVRAVSVTQWRAGTVGSVGGTLQDPLSASMNHGTRRHPLTSQGPERGFSGTLQN